MLVQLRGCLISGNVRWFAAESKQRKAVSRPDALEPLGPEPTPQALPCRTNPLRTDAIMSLREVLIILL